LAKLAAIALLLMLAGCASAGRSFEWDTARQVKVGMTEAELIAVMGKPNVVNSHGESQTWVWVYVHSLTGSRRVSFGLKDGKVASVPNLSTFQ